MGLFRESEFPVWDLSKLKQMNIGFMNFLTSIFVQAGNSIESGPEGAVARYRLERTAESSAHLAVLLVRAVITVAVAVTGPALVDALAVATGELLGCARLGCERSGERQSNGRVCDGVSNG